MFAKYVRTYINLSKKEETEQKTIMQTIHSIEGTSKENMITTDFDAIEFTKNENIPSDTSEPKKLDDNNSECTNKDTIDCMISIPDIELYKYVYSGKNREKYLEQYDLITAASDMKYENGGNYIICGHASRLYGHSLNRLKEVKVGTNIYIYNQNSVDKYTVKSVTYKDKQNTHEFYDQTPKNMITIVSCAKYISEDTYIIVQAES